MTPLVIVTVGLKGTFERDDGQKLDILSGRSLPYI
jgi:hypothetical protein